MRRTERAAYRTKFYSNLSSPTRFDEEPIFSDSIVFSFQHRELAMTDNANYQQLFMRHYELVEEYNEMLGY